MYKNKTLRRMQPTTRRYARLINELESVLRRLDNLKPEIARLELDASALFNQQIHEKVMKQNEADLAGRIAPLYDKALDSQIAALDEEHADD